ncbi:MAG: hypothetical protein AMS22_10590 [Thiotrichales bacterium SG8_50]|nr:MAG: hypothetical protein AMS22_10590 [Thiotrichales bacterium SG8_50]
MVSGVGEAVGGEVGEFVGRFMSEGAIFGDVLHPAEIMRIVTDQMDTNKNLLMFIFTSFPRIWINLIWLPDRISERTKAVRNKERGLFDTWAYF